MNGFGGLLFALGLLLIAVAFGMETSIYASPTIVADQLIGGGSTLNLGLLQKQLMTLQLGIGACITGSIFIAASQYRGVARGSDVARQPPIDEQSLEQRIAVKRTHQMIVVVLCVAVLAIIAWYTF